jgi:hypothetical protein
MAAGYAPNDIYSVVDKLSKLDTEKIDRVVEVLRRHSLPPPVPLTFAWATQTSKGLVRLMVNN